MKRCPKCNRLESVDALTFCRADGTALVNESGSIPSLCGVAEEGRLSAVSFSTISEIIFPNSRIAAKRSLKIQSKLGGRFTPAGLTKDLNRASTSQGQRG